MVSFYKATSKQDMKAVFPIQKVEPISEEPTKEWLMKTNKKLVRCVKTQGTDHGSLGFFVLPANVYSQMTTIPPGSIRQPLNTPFIEVNMTLEVIEATKLE